MPMSAFYMNFSNDHIEIILMVKLHNYFASFAGGADKNLYTYRALKGVNKCIHRNNESEP